MPPQNTKMLSCNLMLRINQLKLTQYRNYINQTFLFDTPLTGICGPNGTGKTNLLDAIYYGCFTKSYFTNQDQSITQFEKDGFRIDLNFNLNDQTKEVSCIYRGASKKEIILNGIPYEKRSEHIGLLSAVMVAPDDIELINGSGEIRRKWLDTLLCQTDKEYLLKLMDYNRILQQRNSLLKQMATHPTASSDLLGIYDTQLVPLGSFIYEKRNSACKILLGWIQNEYQAISNHRETIALDYESSLSTLSFEDILNRQRKTDKALQRTSAGIHRDDLSLKMEGRLFKQIGSQGQKKTMLMAMKLAELEFIKQQKSFYPILMLDDVFEKLDANRMNELLTLVCQKSGIQILITDTHPQRLEENFKRLPIQSNLLQIS